MWRINYKLENDNKSIKVVYNQKIIPNVGERVIIENTQHTVTERIFDYDAEAVTITVEN